MAARKLLHRRSVLRGMGATIALPMLESMLPTGATRRAWAAPATSAPQRMVFVYVPNGIVMNNWTPKGEGPDFEYSRILQPIEKYRDQTLILSGMANYQADALGDGGGDHARAGAAYYTCSHPKKTGGSDIYAGISVDQVMAQAVGHHTRLPSLEVGLDDNRTVGHCDSGYSCAYTNSLSWKSPTTPLPPEANPRLLFERMFGDFDAGLDTKTRERRALYRQSVLDQTREETQNLLSSISLSDRRKVDEYLTTLREVENRIQQSEKDNQQFLPTLEKPSGIPLEFTDHAKIMIDLQLLAMQSDLTRVITFVIGREGSVRTYEQIEVPDPHHPLSHHRNDPDALEKLTKINSYHVGLLEYYLNKMAATVEGDRCLMDSTTLMYGCGHSDSNRHLHNNLPVVLIDGVKAAERKGGLHRRVDKDTPLANLYLGLMHRMGVAAEQFGDSTAALSI